MSKDGWFELNCMPELDDGVIELPCCPCRLDPMGQVGRQFAAYHASSGRSVALCWRALLFRLN